MIISYLNSADPQRVGLKNVEGPTFGNSIEERERQAQRRVDGGATAKEAADYIAARYGVFCAIMADPAPGQIVDAIALSGSAPTGRDTEYLIEGGDFGTMTVGYSYVTPVAPTDGEIATYIGTIGPEETERKRTRELQNLAALIQIKAGTKPFDQAAFISRGLLWYADTGNVTTAEAANYAAAQSAGLIL